VRVSDYIAQFLQSKGADTVYMLSGGGMMHLIDAVGRCPNMSYVCNHHEQASAMAADGFARKTGKIGACYLTAGPGGTNAVTGVVGAWLDSSPVFCISGQSKLSQTIRGSGISDLRQFGTFEVDFIPIVESITKYTAFIDDPSRIKYHMEKAFYLATTGRPGPVWIDVPINIQGAMINIDDLEGFNSEDEFTELAFEKEKFRFALEKLSKAKKPVILAGHGVKASNQVEKFRQLVETLNIPVLTTPFAVDLLPYDSGVLVGHPSVKGDRAGNLAIQNADFILSLGNSFHVMTTGYEVDEFAKGAYKVMLDVDSANFRRQEIHIDLEVNGDIKDALSLMEKEFNLITRPKSSKWLDYCLGLKFKLPVYSEPHKRLAFGEGDLTVNFYDVLNELSIQLEINSTLVTDAGSAFYLVGQAFRPKGQTVINSGGLGSMGFALPAAIGASNAAPEECVVCLTGDGSLQTNIQELATIKSNNQNIKIIIINNNGYVSIRNSQDNYFDGHLVGSSYNSGVWIPPLDKIAEAYGIAYNSCSGLNELNENINALLKTSGPSILEVFTPQDFEVIPTVASQKLEDGSMVSKPLHDMSPFLTEEELSSYMFDGSL
jgi:acetolactate synthase-1/2/3 large subunit